MSDSNSEINEIKGSIADVREWLVRIDTKVDFLNEVKRTAEDAKSIAEEAKQLSVDNKEDIRDMKANAKWLWTTVIGGLGIIIPVLVSVFI